MPALPSSRAAYFSLLSFGQSARLFAAECVVWEGDTPLAPQTVHDTHDAERLAVRHVRGLDAALADGVDTRLHLILESRDLGRGVVCAHDGVVGRMERRMQGVVDVVDDYVALVAADDALTVIGTQGRGLEYGHAAVGEAQGDALLQVDTRLGECARGVDAGYVCTETHRCEVECIDPEVEQRAAAQLGPQDTLHRAYGVAQMCGEHVWRADGAAGGNFGNGAREGHVPCPDGLRKEYTLTLREAYELLGLGGVGREGLLAEYGLAPLEAHARVGVVEAVGRGYVDQVDVGIVGQRLVAAVGLRYVVCRGEGFGLRPVACCYAVGLGTLHGVERRGHLDGDMPRADYSDLESFHVFVCDVL